MTIKKTTDPITGERFVEELIDLPLSKIKYLKYFPHLIGLLIIMAISNLFMCYQLSTIKAMPVPKELCYFSLDPETTLKEHKKLIDNYIKKEYKR